MTEAYTDAQLRSLIALLRHLQAQLPALRRIAGHEDLDQATVAAEDQPGISVRRKLDPGPMFPWELILQQCELLRYA